MEREGEGWGGIDESYEEENLGDFGFMNLDYWGMVTISITSSLKVSPTNRHMILWIEIIGHRLWYFLFLVYLMEIKNKLGGKFSILEVFGVKVEDRIQRPVAATLSPQPRGVG